MNRSQNVTDYPNIHSIFSVWTFKASDATIKSAFERICALVINLNNSFSTRIPDGKASCVLGVGHDAWIKLGLPSPLPKELKNFEPIVGQKHTAVATSADLHFHLRAPNVSICIDMLIAINEVLSLAADCLEEIHGFRYWDGRSILGFVDGTENPSGAARERFGVVGQEDSFYEGGSYLFVQKYLHNMQAWENLTVEEQEKVFGRHKMSDIEMPDEIKPNNSHSALANIEDEDGNELKVVRDNMPFRNSATNELGTYFIAYANKFSTTEKMLERMFLGEPLGNYDRILDFSTARTGSLFFAPALNILKDYSA
ncbi:putative deferrochelatase/peroxidase YfeX [Legionella massiliensis]|uniref:Putative deferrochelatase/peroxidase YfeX n=1 Tax=Legionella massiliensis TaxID=1034943 RepID=A0A078KZP8_9GAMM|nr:Dyp-type peroxidase [Legionella massiliensis]CDZ78386.1 putative deferrochelatase/peroxidase YfeX [Legionella massiliensis]CEE14124.1 putative deferrochelatase/peroxidase YfeX [Legionella massiliensis]